MIIHARCIKDFVGDAFGLGLFEKFEEGRVYALPSDFVKTNAKHFRPAGNEETKPLRQALEIKGNNSTSKRTRKPSRAKSKPQNN